MKGPPKLNITPDKLADTIVAVHLKKNSLHSSVSKFGVSYRCIAVAMEKLEETIKKTGIEESNNRKQITCWVFKYTFDWVKLPVPKSIQYKHTTWEWQTAAYKKQIGDINDLDELAHTFGVSKRTVQGLLSKCYNHFKQKCIVNLRKLCKSDEEMKKS